VIEPVDLKPFLRSAPTVMLLDWNQREPPTGAEIAALRLALDHIKLAVHFALVHDEGNAAPEQALERADRPNSPRRPLFLTASQIAAIVIGLSEFCSSSKRIRRSLNARNDLCARDIAISSDAVVRTPFTPTTAAWAEITAVLSYLRNSAYPFERVGKDKRKWGGGHPAAAWRWTP
jgi:hypothetical protein